MHQLQFCKIYFHFCDYFLNHQFFFFQGSLWFISQYFNKQNLTLNSAISLSQFSAFVKYHKSTATYVGYEMGYHVLLHMLPLLALLNASITFLEGRVYNEPQANHRKPSRSAGGNKREKNQEDKV